MQEYGEGTIFKSRLEGLERAAERYFTNHPNQVSEGKFGCLSRAATGFADRRNEVAHGFVFQVDGISFFITRFENDSPQWALIPSFYAGRAHAHIDGDDFGPTYAYCYRQLWRLTASLETLSTQIRMYRVMLLGAQNATP
jgi:hypothetical protein